MVAVTVLQGAMKALGALDLREAIRGLGSTVTHQINNASCEIILIDPPSTLASMSSWKPSPRTATSSTILRRSSDMGETEKSTKVLCLADNQLIAEEAIWMRA